MKLLLHICCAPCTVFSLDAFRAEGFDPVGLFYNPNIHPLAEYRRRLEALKTYAGSQGLPVRIGEGWPVELWLRAVAGREGPERCRYCYRLRLEQAAEVCADEGLARFSTTLLYSKFQRHEWVREEGERAAELHKVEFIYRDLRLGWKEGLRRTRELAIYRQRYCGCLLSERERFLGTGFVGPG